MEKLSIVQKVVTLLMNGNQQFLIKLKQLVQKWLGTAYSITDQMKQKIDYLEKDFKSTLTPFEEMSPILKNPSELDWNKLIKKSQQQTMTPGEFTLNPETLELDFEKIKPVVINKPEWIGKKRGEVFAEVIRDYSATHYIPGYDYIEWLNKNPDKHRDILYKDYCYAPATVIGRDDGYVRVPCISWYCDQCYYYGRVVEKVWGGYEGVLLLPR